MNGNKAPKAAVAPARNPALEPFCVIADHLALLFSPFVEVIVHDIGTDSVVHVAQALSPRAAGAFEGKRAPVYVATLLGITRATVHSAPARLKLEALA